MLWGQAFAAQLQRKEAEFRRTLDLDPKVAPAHFFLGMLSLRTERLEDAQREFAAELANRLRGFACAIPFGVCPMVWENGKKWI